MVFSKANRNPKTSPCQVFLVGTFWLAICGLAHPWVFRTVTKYSFKANHFPDHSFTSSANGKIYIWMHGRDLCWHWSYFPGKQRLSQREQNLLFHSVLCSAWNGFQTICFIVQQIFNFHICILISSLPVIDDFEKKQVTCPDACWKAINIIFYIDNYPANTHKHTWHISIWLTWLSGYSLEVISVQCLLQLMYFAESSTMTKPTPKVLCLQSNISNISLQTFSLSLSTDTLLFTNSLYSG